jgi:hypothetical protein
MAADLPDGVDDVFAQFLRHLLKLILVERMQVLGLVNRVK